MLSTKKTKSNGGDIIKSPKSLGFITSSSTYVGKNNTGDSAVYSVLNGIPWELNEYHVEWKVGDFMFIGSSNLLKGKRKIMKDFDTIANLQQINETIKTKYKRGISMIEKHLKLKNDFVKLKKKDDLKSYILPFNPDWFDNGKEHFKSVVNDGDFNHNFDLRPNVVMINNLFNFFKKITPSGLKDDWNFAGINSDNTKNNQTIEYETTIKVQSSGLVDVTNIFSKYIKSGYFLVVAVVIHGEYPYLYPSYGKTVYEALKKIPMSYVYHGTIKNGKLETEKVYLNPKNSSNVWVLGRFGTIFIDKTPNKMPLSSSDYKNLMDRTSNLYTKRDTLKKEIFLMHNFPHF